MGGKTHSSPSRIGSSRSANQDHPHVGGSVNKTSPPAPRGLYAFAAGHFLIWVLGGGEPIIVEMIYSISGEFTKKGKDFLGVKVGGVTFKTYVNKRLLEKPMVVGAEMNLFTYLNHKEDVLDLYGFETEEELRFFELLISVSGVGPKSALGILSVGDIKQLEAAIIENRPDLLTKVSGVGKKTAERIIVELKSRVENESSASTVARLDSDSDVVEALVGLGYGRDQVRDVLNNKIPKEIKGLEDRLREALKSLGRRS